ncbi:Glucose-6-phosphate 1-dehydrogenase [Dirofilaria immitis]
MSSMSENGQFKKEKQLSQNVSRGREEIRAILSARNCLSPRELLSLLCTSSTQHSSFCTEQRNDEGTMKSCRKCRKSGKNDMKNLSKIHSSSTSSTESDSTTKKENTMTAKSLLVRSVNSKKAMGLEESSFLSSALKSFSGSES